MKIIVFFFISQWVRQENGVKFSVSRSYGREEHSQEFFNSYMKQ